MSKEFDKTADEKIGELRARLEQSPASGHTAPARQKPQRQRPYLRIVAAAASLLLAVGFGVLLINTLGNPGDPQTPNLAAQRVDLKEFGSRRDLFLPVAQGEYDRIEVDLYTAPKTGDEYYARAAIWKKEKLTSVYIKIKQDFEMDGYDGFEAAAAREIVPGEGQIIAGSAEQNSVEYQYYLYFDASDGDSGLLAAKYDYGDYGYYVETAAGNGDAAESEISAFIELSVPTKKYFATEIRLLQDYFDKLKAEGVPGLTSADDVWIERFYGFYKEYAVVIMGCKYLEIPAGLQCDMPVSGVLFLYSDINPILLWKDGEFLGVSELTARNMDDANAWRRIYLAYKNDFPQAYEDLSLWLSVDEDFSTGGFYFGLPYSSAEDNTELTLADFAHLACAEKLESVTEMMRYIDQETTPLVNRYGRRFFWVSLKEEFQTKEDILRVVFEFEKLDFVAWVNVRYNYTIIEGTEIEEIEIGE